MTEDIKALEKTRFFGLCRELLCVAGYDGYFKFVNPAFETTLGYTKNELITRPFLDFIHPDDIEPTKREVEKQLGEGKAVINFENRYRCQDGTYRILSWNSTPTDEHMYGSARDITEMRRTEEALREAKVAAEQANQELEAFCYSVAHDLRAPLRGIDGFSQILLEDYLDKVDATGQDYLRRTRAAAQRMGMLIDDLLRLSQVSRTELRRESVDLSKVAAAIAKGLETAHPERVVDIVIETDLVAEGDASLLAAAMENLIANAWKYTSRTQRARIEVGVERKNGRPDVFFVRDNGAGFDMQYAGKLFGAFQRLHSPKEFPGTGIGLATVQRIIRRHGGRVWGEGQVEKGATFYFTL